MKLHLSVCMTVQYIHQLIIGTPIMMFMCISYLSDVIVFIYQHNSKDLLVHF